MLKTFPRGGGNIPHRKQATEHKSIVRMPAPERVIIPLSQHIGAPCKPIVKVGDRVKLGQKLVRRSSISQHLFTPVFQAK